MQAGRTRDQENIRARFADEFAGRGRHSRRVLLYDFSQGVPPESPPCHPSVTVIARRKRGCLFPRRSFYIHPVRTLSPYTPNIFLDSGESVKLFAWRL
jgi:hypothetical protein